MVDSKEIKSIDDIVIDIPDKRDYLFDEYLQEEEADGKSQYRPDDIIKLFDQGNSSKCTWYALQHIVNAYNIREDLDNIGESIREQTDPTIYDDNRPHSLQDRLNQFKELGLIEGYLSIPKVGMNTPTGVMTLERRIKEFKIAEEKGFYIYTGTEFVKRTMNQPPILRFEQEKKTGHALSICNSSDIYHSDSNLFKFANSFGREWGDKGYGYIKEQDIDKLFTAYIIIDKNDCDFFRKFKNNKKVLQFLTLAKELYKEGNDEIKKYFEEIKLSNNLTKLYKI